MSVAYTQALDIDFTTFGKARGIEVFLIDAFESGNAPYIAHVMGIVARLVGMDELSAKTGLSHEQLNDNFGDKAAPTLQATLALMAAWDLELTIKDRGTRKP